MKFNLPFLLRSLLVAWVVVNSTLTSFVLATDKPINVIGGSAENNVSGAIFPRSRA